MAYLADTHPPVPALPDVDSMSSLLGAALAYALAGIPVVPFDPTKGAGKSCGNLIGGKALWYEQVTTDADQIKGWHKRFGGFQGLATSPGARGCVVIDVDKPDKFPRRFRPVLDSVPFVNTRPAEHSKRGHYWFLLPHGLVLGNPTFNWGDLRCAGGGVVLPPLGNRKVIRSGEIPPLPDQLAQYLKAGAGCGVLGAHTVDLQDFIATYTNGSRPKKLDALEKMHDKLSGYRSEHDAMREALRVGLSEAKAGCMPAKAVISMLSARWPQERSWAEFVRLAQWAATLAVNKDSADIMTVSNRLKGTDSRRYSKKLARP